MFKQEVASLKEHIHIKRRQVNAYREMNASLTENDLMIQIDFAESYKIADDDEPFHLQSYGGENDIICCHDKSSYRGDQFAKCDGMYKEKNNGYVAICVITGFMKNGSINKDSIISINFS